MNTRQIPNAREIAEVRAVPSAYAVWLFSFVSSASSFSPLAHTSLHLLLILVHPSLHLLLIRSLQLPIQPQPQPHLNADPPKMTSYLSRLSPIPGFPSYTGPHKVGTIDVELPIAQLESPAPAPSDDIPTVQYRIFYPCEPDATGKHISWLPSPQRGYVSAYTRFLGAGSYLAEFISYVHLVTPLISWEPAADSPSDSSLASSTTSPSQPSRTPLSSPPTRPTPAGRS